MVSMMAEQKTRQLVNLEYKGTRIKVIQDLRDSVNPYRIYRIEDYWGTDARMHTRKRMIDKYADFRSVMYHLSQMEWK